MSLFKSLQRLINLGTKAQTPAGRDAMQRQYMKQRKKSQDAADAFPYLMYVATLDPSTRPGHAALDGKVWPKDDPVWRAIYPPNGAGCRCRTRALTAGQVKREGLRVLSPPKLLSRRSESGLPERGVQFVDSDGQQVTAWL